MESDALIQRAKEKDAKAFDALYRTYHPKMLGVCMNIIREDRQTASDLVHDAFILAFVSIGSLKDNAKFSEWLTTIVRNVALKHVRRRDRLRVLPISSAGEEETCFVETSTPEADLSHKELLELISQLPDGYGKVLRLSAIEGFSHKEIADMLGIEPHSSSSQLTRAKRLLRRMIAAGMAVAILLLLLPYMFRHEEVPPAPERSEVPPAPERSEVPPAPERSEERHDGEVARAKDDKHGELPRPVDSIVNAVPSVPTVPAAPLQARAKQASVAQADDAATEPDTLPVIVSPEPDANAEVMIAQEDSSGTDTRDTVAGRVIRPETYFAEEQAGKHDKWQIHVSGSLGQALARSDYRQIATHYPLPSGVSNLPEPDVPTYIVPEHISTWEEYAKFLRFAASPDATADTLALIEIADRNTGRIEQREHHNQPITFGISLAKPLGSRWSIGTGLQYSLLKSQFTLGEGGYSVIDKQKVHYLGIPLHLSYNWLSYKRLSAYSSLGVALHIPVFGKTESNKFVHWQSVYSESRHFTPSLQWQTGISVGLQYKVAPHTSLFAEPTLGWFIPSGSDTHTIWTEHPFMFTCPFGVRITW